MYNVINRRSQGMSGHRVFELGGLSTAQYLLTYTKSRVRGCTAVPGTQYCMCNILGKS